VKFDPPLLQGRFQRRYKRFFADVILDSGELVVAHCPNTGSMKNCLVKDGCCWLSESDNPKRKLKYTLEAVTSEFGGMAGVNTGRTNKLVSEALNDSLIDELRAYSVIESEVRFGEENSRLDFRLSRSAEAVNPEDICYMEVKNLTLALEGGLGAFPDAVTSRGAKHLRELLLAKRQGYRAVLFFCVQHTGIDRVEPAMEIDPEYGKTLVEAAAAGVEIMAWQASINAREIRLVREVPVILPRQS